MRAREAARVKEEERLARRRRGWRRRLGAGGKVTRGGGTSHQKWSARERRREAAAACSRVGERAERRASICPLSSEADRCCSTVCATGTSFSTHIFARPGHFRQRPTSINRSSDGREEYLRAARRCEATSDGIYGSGGTRWNGPKKEKGPKIFFAALRAAKRWKLGTNGGTHGYGHSHTTSLSPPLGGGGPRQMWSGVSSSPPLKGLEKSRVPIYDRQRHATASTTCYSSTAQYDAYDRRGRGRFVTGRHEPRVASPSSSLIVLQVRELGPCFVCICHWFLPLVDAQVGVIVALFVILAAKQIWHARRLISWQVHVATG